MDRFCTLAGLLILISAGQYFFELMWGDRLDTELVKEIRDLVRSQLVSQSPARSCANSRELKQKLHNYCNFLD